MSDECIHGFENGLCAVCSPPAVAEPAAHAQQAKASSKAPAEPRSKASRAASTRTATRPVTHRTAPGAVSKRTAASTHTVDVGEQRLYHVTHVDNLTAIIEAGHLLADTGAAGGAQPRVDIASTGVRDARRETVVPGQSSTVADYVPFYLSPDAYLWNTVRTRGSDPRISIEAASCAARDFVVVVAVAKDIFASFDDSTGMPAYSVTDGDAAASLTRFGTGPSDTERLMRSLRSEDGPARMLNAEFLVKDALPFELVTLIGVCNARVRDEVKVKLKQAGYRARVAVYPPWFQPTEDQLA